MYVKLKDNYINLDLIKKVSEIKAFHGSKRDYEEGDYAYISPIIGGDVEEARLLAISTNGTPQQQNYVVVYGFYIYYLGQEKREKILVGTNRNEAEKYLQAFMLELNNNITSVKEIKKMSKIIETENPVKVVTDGNQLNPMNEVFIWTDELVMEFVKVATMGSYGDYTGLKKLDDKLERFKELKILS